MENGFFKWVWRFNALAIAVAASGVILVLMYALYEMTKNYTRAISRSEVVNTDPEDRSVQETRRVGRLIAAGETNLYRYPVIIEQVYDAGFSSKSTYENIFNYGFLNVDDGGVHWLLDKNDGLITRDETITRVTGVGSNRKTNTIAWLYLVVKSDTNNDNRLSEADTKTLLIARPDGTSTQPLLSNINSFISSQAHDNDTQIVVYNDDEGTHAALVSIGTLTLEKIVAVPLE